MHVEPGILSATKVLGANAAALSTLASQVPGLARRPLDAVKALLAAGCFSVLMQLWHTPVGPSELHLIGASAIYFTFGFLPTLFGFAIGLLLQGLLFEPQDLLHLGVNSLSLMLPLIAAHGLVGRDQLKLAPEAVRWTLVLRFDAVYYGGVVAMVGFWLALGQEPTPFASWLAFAFSYVPLILCEPALTCGVLALIGRLDPRGALRRLTPYAGTAVA